MSFHILKVNWTENMAMCCSLGLNPIIFNSWEDQQCVSNFTSSRFKTIFSFYSFKKLNKRKLDGKPELLDWWKAGVQRFLGLVLRSSISTIHSQPKLGNEPTGICQRKGKLSAHEDFSK